MEPPAQHEAPTTSPSNGLRRRKGLQLAVTAPAVFAALHSGVAAADDDQGEDHDDRGEDHDEHEQATSAAATLPLSRANDVNANASGDFNSSGGDSLSSGRVVLGPRNGSTDVAVTVNGAPANTPYTLQFRHFQDHNQDTLGTFTTNSSGHFSGHVGTLSGHHRVGVFVVQGGSTDQFVTSVNL